MESRAKALGHPIHQMLIPFPFGLLATAVIFDIIYLFVGNPSTADTLATVAFWMIAAGIVGGVARRRARRPPRRRRGRRRAPRRAQLAHHQLGARRRARERAVRK